MTAAPAPGGRSGDEPLDETGIVRFLEERPDFLNRHPSLYLTLDPPARRHGEAVADHMAAMLDTTRRQNAQLRDDVRLRRTGLCFTALVERALLWLVRARDPIPAASHELPLLLAVDTAELCLETPRPGTRTLPPGTIAPLLRGQDVRLRDAPHPSAALHGDASALVVADILVRIPLETGGPALLTIGSRDAQRLAPGSEAPLALLGRALAGALERA